MQKLGYVLPLGPRPEQTNAETGVCPHVGPKLKWMQTPRFVRRVLPQARVSEATVELWRLSFVTEPGPRLWSESRRDYLCQRRLERQMMAHVLSRTSPDTRCALLLVLSTGSCFAGNSIYGSADTESQGCQGLAVF